MAIDRLCEKLQHVADNAALAVVRLFPQTVKSKFLVFLVFRRMGKSWL